MGVVVTVETVKEGGGFSSSRSLERNSWCTAGASSPSRRADIQGLRALAVVLVVLFHAGGVLTGGYVGVDVFFVVSGFVIMAMLLREFDGTGTLDLKRFFTRRVRRLLPALGVMLTLTALGSALILSPLGAQQSTAATGLAASLFAANVQLHMSTAGYFATSSDLNPLLHTWSLAVEEQFYLLFPVGLYLTWTVARRSPRAAALVALVAVGAASLTASVLLTDAPEQQTVLIAPRQFSYFASPTRAWEFVAGALLAFIPGPISRLSTIVGRAMSIAGLGIILWCAVAYTHLTAFPGLASIPPVLATVMLLVGGGASTEGVTALLGSAVPVRLGDLSYSWYLWHWPTIVFVSVLFPDRNLSLLAGFGSIAVAMLSYVFIEARFRHDDNLKGRRAIGLAVACIAVPAVAMTGLRIGAEQQWGIKSLEAVAESADLHGDVVNGCDVVEDVVWEQDRCTWRADQGSSQGQILLLGDSHAGHLTEAVTGAGNELGYDVTVRTKTGCPFVQMEVRLRGGSLTGQCFANVKTALDQAIETQPDLVVLSTAIRKFLLSESVILGDDDDYFDLPQADRISIWQSGFDPVLQRLDDAGIPVLVVQPLPRFADWELRACSIATLSANPADCGREVDRAEVLAEREPFAIANRDSVDRFELASTVDLFDRLCPAQTCVTNDGSTFIYRDDDHLTVAGSTRLVDDFVPVLMAATTR